MKPASKGALALFAVGLAGIALSGCAAPSKEAEPDGGLGMMIRYPQGHERFGGKLQGTGIAYFVTTDMSYKPDYKNVDLVLEKQWTYVQGYDAEGNAKGTYKLTRLANDSDCPWRCNTSGEARLYQLKSTIDGANPCPDALGNRQGCELYRKDAYAGVALVANGGWFSEQKGSKRKLKWNDANENGAEKNEFMVSCIQGAVGKCVHMGYPPSASCEKTPLEDYFRACYIAASADYGGNARSHTCDGTVVDFEDKLGINPKETTWPFEADWTVDGVAKKRGNDKDIEFRPRYKASTGFCEAQVNNDLDATTHGKANWKLPPHDPADYADEALIRTWSEPQVCKTAGSCAGDRKCCPN